MSLRHLLAVALLGVGGCSVPSVHPGEKIDVQTVAPPVLTATAPMTAMRANVFPGVYVRVVDTGAGECCIIKVSTPETHYAIIDAGMWDSPGKAATRAALHDIIPEGAMVDLLVISHTDGDHLGSVPEICNSYHVKTIIHPTLPRTSATYAHAMAAIASEVSGDHAVDINLASNPPAFGTDFRWGMRG